MTLGFFFLWVDVLLMTQGFILIIYISLICKGEGRRKLKGEGDGGDERRRGGQKGKTPNQAKRYCRGGA